MEILDPDLWNDDGSAKKPTAEYMQRLDAAQRDAGTFARMAAEEPNEELAGTYLDYARLKSEARTSMGATVGDIVHFWDGTACRAAMVVGIQPPTHDLELHVFIPKLPLEYWYAGHDEMKKEPASWHWAEDAS